MIYLMTKLKKKKKMEEIKKKKKVIGGIHNFRAVRVCLKLLYSTGTVNKRNISPKICCGL